MHFLTAIAMVASLGCVTQRQGSAPPSTGFSSAAEVARIQLESIRERSNTPAVGVAVVHRGHTVFSEVFGTADIERDVKATTATRFGIGSITKCFTSVAAVSLEREGKIDLDAPLETYLPGFAHSGKGITPRLILTHMSGLDDAFATQHYWTTQSFTVQEAADLIGHDGLAHEPGDEFLYATGPYTLVGAALERATGLAFEKIIVDRVLRPAGMTATIVNRPRERIKNRTRFYRRRDDGAPEPAPMFDPTHKLPGAGYLSTVEDVAKFGDALLSGKLLDETGMKRLFAEARTRSGDGTGYALGFQLAEDPVHGPVYHLPGGGPGISAWLVIYPKRHITFAILSNMTSAPVGAKEFQEIQDAFLEIAAKTP